MPNAECSRAGPRATKNGRGVRPASAGTTGNAWVIPIKAHKGWYQEVRLGANVRINALSVWRVFQAAMPSHPRLHATSTAKSISGDEHGAGPLKLAPSLAFAGTMPAIFEIGQECREQPEQWKEGTHFDHKYDAGGVGEFSEDG